MKQKDDYKQLTVIAPGAMKPFHDGHYSLIKSYAENNDMPVFDVVIIISQKERSGISAQSTFDFLYNISVRMSHKLGVAIKPEICGGKTPLTASYFKILNPETDDQVFTVLSSNKDGDDKRLDSFKRDFGPDGKYSDHSESLIWLNVKQTPLVYYNRSDKFNTTPVSATIARIDIANDDFDNFCTNYKMMLDDNVVTEEELKDYFNILKDEVILSKDDLKKMNESLKIYENKYFMKNKFQNKMNYSKSKKFSRLTEGEDLEYELTFDNDFQEEDYKRIQARRHRRIHESLKAKEPRHQDKVDRSEASIADWVKFFKENKEELKNERKMKDASKSIKSEAKKLAKYGANYLNITGMKDLKRKLAKIDPSIKDLDSELSKKVNEAVSLKKLTLYDNITIEGKKLNKLGKSSIKSYRDRAESVLEQLMQEKKDMLNEGYRVNDLNKSKIATEISRHKNLIKKLDEELCYRNAMLQKLLKESDENSDKPAESNENPDEDQIIDVSAIIVEVKEKGKDEFVKELKAAGIPEDSIEVVEDKEGEDSDNETNESAKYSKLFKALLEDEEAGSAEEQPEEDLDSADDEAEEQPSEEDAPADDEAEDKTVKIRIVADYADKLIDVLKDSYNFSDNEIDELIGGEIVSDEEGEKAKDSSDNGDDEEGLDSFKNALADLNLDDIEDENI